MFIRLLPDIESGCPTVLISSASASKKCNLMTQSDQPRPLSPDTVTSVDTRPEDDSNPRSWPESCKSLFCAKLSGHGSLPPSASSDQNLSIFFSLTAEDLEWRNFDMIAENESKIGSSTIMPMTEASAGH